MPWRSRSCCSSKNVSMNCRRDHVQGNDINFTVGGVAASTISFDPGSYTLQEVATRISDAKLGVTATVVNTTGGGQQ